MCSITLTAVAAIACFLVMFTNDQRDFQAVAAEVAMIFAMITGFALFFYGEFLWWHSHPRAFRLMTHSNGTTPPNPVAHQGAVLIVVGAVYSVMVLWICLLGVRVVKPGFLKIMPSSDEGSA